MCFLQDMIFPRTEVVPQAEHTLVSQLLTTSRARVPSRTHFPVRYVKYIHTMHLADKDSAQICQSVHIMGTNHPPNHDFSGKWMPSTSPSAVRMNGTTYIMCMACSCEKRRSCTGE